MVKFSVYGVGFFTTRLYQSQAETKEEALEEFWDSDEVSPSLCNYCATELSFEELSGYVIMNENHNVIEESINEIDRYKTINGNLKKQNDILLEAFSEILEKCSGVQEKTVVMKALKKIDNMGLSDVAII